MKIDARTLMHEQVVESDVCIIGAGPAGTTLAREFLDSGIRVSLLESGSDKFDTKTHQLSKGTLSGEIYEPLESTHLRQIGGTANNWILQMTDNQYGYRYTPLDEIDFEQRDEVPHSGWPIRKADLDPYYARVQEACDIGPYQYSAEYWTKNEMLTLPLPPGKAYNSVFLFGPTKKFTKDFPAQITDSQNVNIYAHATVVELLSSEDGSKIERALVRTFEGKEIYFTAKQFIISANALQTPRLLLNSKRHHPNGIGNQHDNVGRYYMDHVLLASGNFVPHDPSFINKLGFYDMQGIAGASVLGRINLSPEIMRKEGLRNFSAMLFPMPWSESDIDAMNSVIELKLNLTYNFAHFPENLGPYFLNIIRGRKRLFRALISIFRGRNRLFRALYESVRYGVPFLVGLGRGGWSRIANNEKKYNRLELLALIEQSPSPNNRVTLTDEKDELGCPRIKVHYTWDPQDIASIARAQKIMAEALIETGLGSYEPPKLPVESVRTFWGAHHMMGTTRMSDDPRDGVVDRDCRVHGVENLYIAGSATFTTGGYANPTLTNLALSIRVADRVKEALNHLKKNLQYLFVLFLLKSPLFVLMFSHKIR
ncbi:MAG TPA: GMC family oxidoreductase [Methylotenera sp.]|nr:GMC family oxidoreductase [Methylotenera sp.]